MALNSYWATASVINEFRKPRVNRPRRDSLIENLLQLDIHRQIKESDDAFVKLCSIDDDDD